VIWDRLFGAASTAAAPEGGVPNFSGKWFTTYGSMELAQDGNRVRGYYRFQGQQCSIEGALRDGRLQFEYREPTIAGEGWFELVSHGKFAGKWRPAGTDRWAGWTGRRGYEGIWETSYGLMRLVQEPGRVHGYYEGQGPSSIEGTLEDARLHFRYRESRAKGEGHFELAPDGETFSGEWRADGAQSAVPWQGRRLEPAAGVSWLVVIEAHWQHSFLDREYDFGSMLREFFTRLSHVQVRHRFFEDEAGLQRWVRELMYLPEPVVVVISSHGTEEGLSVHGRTLDTGRLVESMRHADSVQLLHFSSCLMMHEGKVSGLARALQQSVRFPVSGYDRSVDWAASALVDFHYLDMVLGRGLAPAEAARQVRSLVAYAGDAEVEGSPYPAVGLRILTPDGDGRS
jgi:hypothetical protein